MSDKLKDYLDQFHNHGVFIPTKTMILTGPVDYDMYDMAVKNIHSLDSMTGTITIKLMSEGGDVVVARAIYDLIAGAKNYVRIQCYGETSSAATIILQAADYRVMSPNSRLMLHIGREGVPEDHPNNVNRAHEVNKKDGQWMKDIYYNRIKEKKKRFTRQKLDELLLWDTYLYPKQAVELGLVDEIGEIS